MNYKGKKGVDISSVNGDVDIQKIKDAGYDFVMIRCGFGSDIKSQDDSQFENNVRKCEKIGMPWGTYLYSYALNTDEAKSEAEHVIRLLKNKKPSFPVAFDMEDADGYKSKNGMPSNSKLIAICKTFLSRIKSAGYYPMLYASLSWLNNQLNDSALLNNYDIWVAQWNSTCDYQKDAGMWQYGGEVNYLESNSIDGVGLIDKNKCFKDYPTIIKKGNWNNWSEGDSGSVGGSDNQDKKPEVTYCVKTLKRGWLPTVKDLEDYAGVPGDKIVAFAVKVNEGSVWYQAHVKGGGWLQKVTGFSTTDTNKYAGNGQEIDAVRIYYETSRDMLNNNDVYKAKYRTSRVGADYYSWQYDDEKSNGQDGYAGSFGKSMDRLQITLDK
ncbi:MAG: glycoside hydrolase family 25 protein [Ruminococcus bromii]|nr:glycoside hydrolase family 25 protein [Ruminococcus bromii]